MTEVNDAPCTSCGELKHTLRVRESKLWPGMNLYLCTNCFDNRYEPRWLVVMVLAQGNNDLARDYVLKHRYVGAEIPAKEYI